MARDGSGTYNLPAGQPVSTGTVIDSTVFNTLTADLKSTLTASIAKDGQTTPTGNLPMGGFKHTGVADATVRTQYTSAGQVQDAGLLTLSAVAGADTITASLTPAITAYVSGQTFRFLPASTNTTAATLNINGIAAKSIVKGATGGALIAGDLVAGVPATVVYNGTSFYLQNPSTALAASFADGTLALPGVAFSADPDTGMYRPGANSLGFSVGGVLTLTVNSLAVIPGAGAAIFADDGVVGRPGYNFLNDQNTGVYRIGADNIGVSVGGVKILDIQPSAVSNSAAWYGVDGSVGTPSYAFASDPDTGIYRSAVDQLAFTAGGVQRMIVSGVVSSFFPNYGADGSAGAPQYTFTSDPDTGMYRVGANQLGISTGGTSYVGFQTALASATGSVSALAASSSTYSGNFMGAGAGTTIGTNSNLRLASSAAGKETSIVFTDGSVWNTWIGAVSNGALSFSVSGTGSISERVRIETNGQLTVSDGTNSLPGVAFISDPDTGLYRIGANILGFAVGGAEVLRLDNAATGNITMAANQLLNLNGTVALPVYSFTSDPDTGLYRIGANNPGMSAGNSLAMDWVAAASGGARVADLAGTMQTVGYRQIPRSTTATTLAANDVGKCVAITAAINIPISVFAAGDAITIYNDSAGALNITIAAGTLRLAGTATTGTRSLAARGFATLWFNVGGATPEVIASGNVT